MNLSLHQSHWHRATPLHIDDATKGKDPTKTYYLRARMRAEGDRRWQSLARTIRQALIEHDLIGMRGVGRIPHGDKTEGFAAWLHSELQHKILGYDGSWTKPYISQAALIAQRHATSHAPGGLLDPQRVVHMQSLTISELKGIASAAQQKITRVVTHAMMANDSPTRLANNVAAVIKEMRNRTRAMSEYCIAKTHATSTLSAFADAGVTHVGIIPERKRRITRPVHDAKKKKKFKSIEDVPTYEEVDVMTAGDDNVCPVCEDISANGPYELDEAEDLIPAHAWCRCSFVPAGKYTHEQLDHSTHPWLKFPRLTFDEDKGHPFRGNQYVTGESGGAKEDVAEMTKVGGQLGSNKGGVYTNKAGEKFYVKEPMTEAHVTNEKVAAALYKLAGANTLEYVDAGPKHVATKWQELSKNNTSQLSASERAEAQKDFAVHAWTANWDAAGLTGDNQGVTKPTSLDPQGKITTLDVGGALEYRAQGQPKGAAFGTKVTELDSLRSYAQNNAAAKLFGDMTHEQIKESAQKVTSLSNADIEQTVLKAGGTQELADKMIARRNALEFAVENKQYQIPPNLSPTETSAKLSAILEKAKAAEPQPTLKPSEVSFEQTKPAKPLDPPEHVAKVEQWLKGPLKTGSEELKGLKNLAQETKDPALKAKVLGKLLQSYEQKQKNYQQAGKHDKVGELAPKIMQVKSQQEWEMKKAGQAKPVETPQQVQKTYTPEPTPSPTTAAPAPTTSISAKEPTSEEMKKASKGTQLSPYTLGLTAGMGTAGLPATEAVHSAVKAFNEKYSGKNLTNPEEIKSKIAEYKNIQSLIPAANKEIEANKEAIEKKQAAELKEKQSAAAESNKKYMQELGISETEATGFHALVQMMAGKSSSQDVINEFKGYEKAAGAKDLPVTGFQYALLKNYIDGGYHQINKALREGSWTPAQHVYARLVNNALDKVPKYSGPVERGTNLTPEQIAQYKPGHVIEERSFTSTGKGFHFNGNVLYHIEATGKRGADVSQKGGLPGEKEVLFKAHTFFLVHKVEQSGGKTHIHMEEVEGHG